MNSFIRLSIIVFLAGIVSGCGFQLRGDVQVPDEAKNLHLVTPSNALEDEFAVYLLDAGVNLTPQAQGADSVLRLSNEQYEKRTLSVDPDTGKEREFEITYSVAFSLRTSDGDVLIKRQAVELQRDYVFDADQVIGKSREESLLRAEMRRDAVQQILRRIEASVSQ